MQTALCVVAVYVTAGVACVICQGPTAILGVMASYHVRKYGRLPSRATEIRTFAGMIVLWPRWYWSMAR